MDKEKKFRDQYHLSEFHLGDSAGQYNIPKIKRECFIPSHLIDFSQALTSKDFQAGIHFYIDDARFERIWRNPQRYLPILKRFSCVFTPDFYFIPRIAFFTVVAVTNRFHKHIPLFRHIFRYH